MIRQPSKIFIVMLMCSFLLLACQSNNEVIKVGVVGTMTGSDSDLAVSGRRGAELALKEFNKKQERPFEVELVVKDDMNDPETAKNVCTEFVDEGVKYIIGHYTSGMQTAVYGHTESDKVLYISPTVSADALEGIDDNFIRFIDTTAKQADALNNIAAMKGQKRFAIIYDSRNVGFFGPMIERFEDNLLNAEGQVIYSKGFDANLIETSESIIHELEQYNPEAVFIIANAQNNIMIQKQMRKFSMTVPVYSALWSNTFDFVQKGGADIEGTYLISATSMNHQSVEYSQFISDYESEYGELPTFSSIFSYEAMAALLESLDRNGNDIAQVKSAFLNKDQYMGLLSNYNIDVNGDCNREYKVVQVVNGKKVDIK